MTSKTPERQTGRTTKQIQTAPKHAIFIWCNSHLMYPIGLARQFGRVDITFVAARPGLADWLCGQNRHIVIDHYATLNPELRGLIDNINAKKMPNPC